MKKEWEYLGKSILEMNRGYQVFEKKSTLNKESAPNLVSTKELEEKEKYLFKMNVLKKNTNLSNKELDMCFYFWKAYNSKQISETLNISHGSVRVNKRKIIDKFGLSSSVELRSFLNNFRPTKIE